LNGNVVTIVSAGKETITASQAGDLNYNAAIPVQQTFCVNPAQPTVTLSGDNTTPPTLTSSASSGNQWFLNDTAISGATNSAFSITAAGIYSVQATTTDGCASLVSANFSIVVTGDIILPQAISLYPNPSRDYIFIAGLKDQVTGLSVIDMTGQANAIRLEKEDNLLKGDVRNYAGGFYILRVTTAKSVSQIKFVKQ
jgi:hypothetical protein